MAACKEAPVAWVNGAEMSSDGQIGRAAAAGIEAVGTDAEESAGAEVSVSGMSRYLNKGGWSVGKGEVNHMLLYI